MSIKGNCYWLPSFSIHFGRAPARN